MIEAERGLDPVDVRHRQPRHRAVLRAGRGGPGDGRPTTSRIGYGGLKKRLDLPTTGPSACPSVYSFSYGNVGIISLDANELSWEIQGLLDYSDGAQVRWLEDTLAAWRSDPAIDFIVAFFHECAFSTCDGHSSDGGVRAALAPLFSKYQVDLAIQGHNHVYERTNPLLYDAEDQQRQSCKQAVAISPQRARRGRAGQGRHHLRGRRHGRHAPVQLDRRRRDRPQLRGRAGQRPPSSATPKTQIGPYVTQHDFSQRVRDRRLVPGPVRRLRLHRPRRHPAPPWPADHDDAAVHQPAGPGARPRRLLPRGPAADRYWLARAPGARAYPVA